MSFESPTEKQKKEECSFSRFGWGNMRKKGQNMCSGRSGSGMHRPDSDYRDGALDQCLTCEGCQKDMNPGDILDRDQVFASAINAGTVISYSGHPEVE